MLHRRRCRPVGHNVPGFITSARGRYDYLYYIGVAGTLVHIIVSELGQLGLNYQ